MRLRLKAWKARRHARVMSILTTEKTDIIAVLYYGGTRYEVGVYRNGKKIS